MADAIVRVVESRAVVSMEGADLLSPLVAAAAASAAAAEAALEEALTALAIREQDLLALEESLPLAKGVVIGDSHVDYGNTATGAGVYINSEAVGMIEAAWAMLPRWNNDNWLDLARGPQYTDGANQGVAGERSDQWLARIQHIIDQGPAWVFIGGPTNDPLQSVPAATTIANISAIADAFRLSGIPVILETISPMTAAALPLSDPKRVILEDSNDGIRAYTEGKANVYLLDTWALADDGSATVGGLPKSGWVISDGIHRTVLMQWTVARTFIEILQRFLPSRRAYRRFTDGNLLTNPHMTGTAGTASSPVTGTVPTGWRVRRGSGTSCTAVASVEANAVSGGQTTVVTITLAGAAAVEYFIMRLASPAETVDVSTLTDQWVSLQVELEVTGTAWRGLKLTADPFQQALDFLDLNTDKLPSMTAQRLLVKTPPFKLAAGNLTADLNLYMAVDPAGGGTPVCKVLDWRFGLEDDPRVVRNLA